MNIQKYVRVAGADSESLGRTALNRKAYFDNSFDEHERVIADARATLSISFGAMLDTWLTCVRNGGKILFFGNGGSSSDAQHLAAELTVRYVKDRKAIAALALATDSSSMSATGNDLGFDFIFSRQIEALGRPGDVAVGISTSGRSKNVLAALRMARATGLVATALSGGDGGQLVGLADPLIIVPSKTTSRIQEAHIVLGHMLCGALEIELGADS